MVKEIWPCFLLCPIQKGFDTMFRLLKNGDVYAPEHIGKADILICNDKIVDIAEHILSLIHI